jgi:hypothetical protein
LSGIDEKEGRISFMKKILTTVLALVFALALLTLTACGGGGAPVGDGAGASGGGQADLSDAAEDIVEDAIESNLFSTEAADAAMQALGGLGLEQVKPDFPYILDDETMANYGDDSDYGHASFFFIKDGGDVTEEEYETWLKKVYDATAEVADDKQNIQGYGFGDGDVPKSFEEVLSGGFMQVWSYKYNGRIMDVYPGTEYGSFTVSESKVYGTDESGDIGIKIDIAVGMQKPMDEYEEDIDKAFEEHGDEIEDALKDFAE